MNLDSLSSRGLYREDVPRHTYFYNERTVRAYLANSGFDLIGVKHNDEILSMLPSGWLIYKVNRLLGRPRLSFDELTLHFGKWLTLKRLPRTTINAVRYLVSHPLFVLDRLTFPIYAQWQILTGTYGVSTYVARKKPL